MAFFGKSLVLYVVLIAVLLSLFATEIECRRNVLHGRKTVTRTYLKQMAIPAWAIIILVGLGQLIVGGVAYVIMRKTIIDPPMQGSYAMAATSDA